jgi:protein-disulfide isomerase
MVPAKHEDDMSKLSRLFATAALAGLAFASPAISASFDDTQKSAIEDIVRNYLLEHPEILREMADKLETRDKEAEETTRNKALVTYKDEVFKSPRDPMIGNPKGDVSVVEFMDYNCGWCKKAVSEVSALVAQDKNVKVTFKEFPIFGEHSEYAARAALAAAKQGKYWELHQAMYAHEGQVTTDVVNQLAEAQGLDMTKLKADVDSKEIGEQIAANMQLAKSLALSGTPAFVIDAKVYGGFLDMDSLNAAVAEVRANGCKMC